MTEHSVGTGLLFFLLVLIDSLILDVTAALQTAAALSDASFANASLTVTTVHVASDVPPLSVGNGLGSGSDEADDDPCQALLHRRAQDYGGARALMLSRPGSWAFLVVFSAAALIGVAGNVLSIYIYAFRVKRTPTTVFIVMLAVVDLTVCLLVMPQRFASLLLVPIGSDVLCKGGEFLFFLALPMSCFILLAIAIERFVTICLSKVNWLTPTAMRATLVAIFILSALIASPSLLTVTVYSRVPAAMPPVVCNVGLCKPTYEYISQEADWSYWLLQAAMFAVMAIAILAIYATIFARLMVARSRLSRWKPGSCERFRGVRGASARGGLGGALGSVTAVVAGATAERQAFAVAVDNRMECTADTPMRTETMELSETTANGAGGGGGSRTALSMLLAYDSAAKAADGNARGRGDGSTGCPMSDDRDARTGAAAPSCTRLPANEFDVVVSGSKSALAPTSSAVTATRPHRMQKRRSHLNTAVGLCTITGAFIVAYTPVFVMSLTGMCDHGGGAPSGGGADDCEWPSTWSVLWHFFLLNHAANPIIYAFMNTRFKEALRSMVYGSSSTDGACRRRLRCK